MQKVILVGNPNTGKTTLFNSLTFSREHASNWHGVTVAVKEKPFKIASEKYLLCDLPGVYSLESYSEEEKIACDYLKSNSNQVVLCIVDANNLRRNLLLLMELKKQTENIILVVNMANEVKGLDALKLQKEMGVECVLVDARKRKSLVELCAKIQQLSTKLKMQTNNNRIKFDDTRNPLDQNRAKTNVINNDCDANRLSFDQNQAKDWTNKTIIDLNRIKEGNKLSIFDQNQDRDKVDFNRNNYFQSKSQENSTNFDLKAFEKQTKNQFDKIDNILRKIDYKVTNTYGSSPLDKLFLNNVLSIFIFILIMGLVFFITFGCVGSFLSTTISAFFEYLSHIILLGLGKIISSQVVLSFIEEAVLGGALSVLGFVPQIMLLFTCLNFLEDVGYLSRVAFMFDSLFKRLGLTGRSVFSLIMGFGCTTSAVMTTRGLETKSLRKKTTILLPFMSCSAKLPIYAVICSAFFEKYKALMVFALYLLALLVMIVVSLLFKDKEQAQKNSFMLEMPKYRLPNLQKVFSNAFDSAKSFIIRVGGLIVLCNVVIYLLFNFSFTLEWVGTNSTQSILYVLADKTKFIFAPLGLGSAYVVVALLSGFVAKEMVVSTLAILNSTTMTGLATSLSMATSPVYFTTPQAISFLVFVLLYSPCVSALASINREVGRKSMLLSLFLSLGSAYLVSFTLYQSITLILTGRWVLAVCLFILIAILTYFVLKYKKRKPTTAIKNCMACGGCKGEVWK